MATKKLSETEHAIISARVRAGDKRADVAREMGVNRSTVTRICNSTISATQAAISAEMRAAVERHILDDKDTAVTALLEDAQAIREATLDDFVSIQTIKHVARDKQGVVIDEWERDEPCIDWAKARDAGVLRNLKKFSNTTKGQTVEFHDRSLAAGNIEKVARMRGWIVDKQEVTGKDGAPLLSGITVTFVDPK